MSETSIPSGMSRRDFTAAAVAATAAAGLSSGAAWAQGGARYRRHSISEPGFPRRVLDSYKKAIRAMLALPPSDPRNWYRHALVHTIDCPHGNWWFLVWHRAYLGWFEQACRELSGDPDFALPYWDWTREPRVPKDMFDDVLTPTDPAYIATFADFRKAFDGAVADLWKTASPEQVNALLVRGLRFPADLWFDIENNPMFFDRAAARGLTPQAPDFDAATARTVSLPTVLNALAPRDFITFGSARTLFHSGMTGFGVLEGQPHNRVHNCVGGFYMSPPRTGFMQDNLSPVDPVFFLHHANIDRLWDVWTRKQRGFGLPTLPTGGDLTDWSRERFLFFTDAKGAPVTRVAAGDYAEIGPFDYDYQPGSGEEVVPRAAATAPSAAVQSFDARVTERSITAGGRAGGTVTLPAQALAAGAGGPAALFATITIAQPPIGGTHDFRVLIGDGGGPSDDTAVTLSIFGRHIMHSPVSFTVPLSPAVDSLRAANRLAADAPLTIRVEPAGPAGSAGGHAGMRMSPRPGAAEPTPEIVSITVQAH